MHNPRSRCSFHPLTQKASRSLKMIMIDFVLAMKVALSSHITHLTSYTDDDAADDVYMYIFWRDAFFLFIIIFYDSFFSLHCNVSVYDYDVSKKMTQCRYGIAVGANVTVGMAEIEGAADGTRCGGR
jgi:hypothetical protein